LFKTAEFVSGKTIICTFPRYLRYSRNLGGQTVCGNERVTCYVTHHIRKETGVGIYGGREKKGIREENGKGKDEGKYG